MEVHLKFARRAAALATLLAIAVTLIAAAPKRPASAPAKPASPPAAAPAAAPAPSSLAETGGALDAVAAMVNDEAVLVSDVEEGLFAFLQQSGARPDSMQIDTLRRQVLDQLVDDRLMQAEAKRLGIAVTDAEVTRAVDFEIGNAKERMGGEQAFQEQLKREGLTEAQLRERFRTDLRKGIAVDRLKQKQVPERKVPQAEAEAYFSQHRDKFPRVPPEVQLQVIQIQPEPDSAAVAAGLAKITAARKRVVGGEKFAKVAAEVSEDPGSAKAGGDLGFFSPGRMVKVFEDAVFALKLNDLSPPVRSPFGWHVIQVLERDTLKAVGGADSLDAAGKPIPEVHARHILIRLQPEEADVSRAEALAARVRDEARKGTSFATLVHRYSKYDGPANADGDVGFVSLANLQPQIRDGLDTLEIGQVSEVMTNQSGFNIFKVLDRHPEREYVLDEVRAELPKAVAEIQRRERYDTWIKSLRAKAHIEYR